MKTLNCLAVGFLMMGATLFAGTGAIVLPPPDNTFALKPEVISLGINGSGCPKDKALASYHWEGNDLVVQYAAMAASKGAGMRLSEGRKNCVTTLQLKAPAGYRYAVASYRAEGYVSLAEYDKANFTLYAFETGKGANDFSVSLDRTAAENGDFSIGDPIARGARLYSNCGAIRPLNTNAAIRVQGSSKTDESFAALDSLRLTFELSRCN